MTATEESLRWITGYTPPLGQALVPGLVGPTGAGKTMLAGRFADESSLRLVTLLLGTLLPEDVLGLPSIIDGITRWSQPAWAATAIEYPTLLLLDELDKARPEVLATILTLISSREIRGVSLHPKTRIVTAMQPVDDYWLHESVAEALAARSVWLPMGYDYAELERLGGISLGWATRPPRTQVPILPVPSGRQLLYLAQLRASTAPQHVLKTIAQGVLPESLVEEYLRAPVTALNTHSYWHMSPDDLDAYLNSITDSHAAEIALEGPDGLDTSKHTHALALLHRLERMVDHDVRSIQLRQVMAQLVRACAGEVHAETPDLLLYRCDDSTVRGF